MSLDEEATSDTSVAQAFIDAGTPVFRVRRSPSFPDGGSGDTGYLLPAGWQNARPDPSVLDRLEPGDGLCAVMGHGIDAIDIDPRNGGEKSLKWMKKDGLLPTVYGSQTTPSGGRHLFVESLGVRSRDGLFPGIDLKAGVDGVGHGFVFIAPTEKISKETGEVVSYESGEIDLTMLMVGDDSGRALANHVHDTRSRAGDGVEYDGPSYEDLSTERQARAQQYVETELFDWQMRLADASTWPDGYRPGGMGWEALSRNCAWAIARMAVAPWTSLAESDAESEYDRIMPEVIAKDPKCRGKWYEGLLEKAAAQPADPPPWWSEVFFDQTETLQKIRQHAESRLMAPEGMLAAVLGRVIAEVPPEVMLPDVIGARASLNIGIALVGPSGIGKSSIMRASRDVLGFPTNEQEKIEDGVGSGEGLIDKFLKPEMEEDDKGKLRPTGEMVLVQYPHLILTADEVDQMAAVGRDRQGSTLGALLRTGLTGGALKIANARAGGRSRAVSENTYRLVAMIGVQPARADVLLSEKSVGTPQRFLWAKLTNPGHPDEDPERPEPLDWVSPEFPEEIDYPAHIADEVKKTRRRALREETSEEEILKGHTTLTRLKVAFALAALHGETKITDRWWTLAGSLVSRSLQVQEECEQYLSRDRDAREVSRVTRQMKAQAKAAEVISESQLEKAADATYHRLKKRPGMEGSWTEVKPASRLREGLETEEIVEELVKRHPEVKIEEYEAQGRVAYRIQIGDE